jgi:hypothetical protein
VIARPKKATDAGVKMTISSAANVDRAQARPVTATATIAVTGSKGGRRIVLVALAQTGHATGRLGVTEAGVAATVPNARRSESFLTFSGNLFYDKYQA